MVVGVILVAALAGGAWWLRKTKVTLDEATNCPVTGPSAIHVVMFDRSDPVSGQQGQRIRQDLQSKKDHARFGERFDIYTFEGDTKATLVPILSLCSPGRPEDANELIENPELIRRRYEAKFSDVLDRTIEELLQESTRPSSPIIESIKAAAVTSFGAVDDRSLALRVTLISDMIQHTELISQIRKPVEFEALAKDAAWPGLRPALKGAEVQILYVLRGSPIQSRGHQLFWEKLIDASGGNLESIEPI